MERLALASLAAIGLLMHDRDDTRSSYESPQMKGL